MLKHRFGRVLNLVYQGNLRNGLHQEFLNIHKRLTRNFLPVTNKSRMRSNGWKLQDGQTPTKNKSPSCSTCCSKSLD